MAALPAASARVSATRASTSASAARRRAATLVRLPWLLGLDELLAGLLQLRGALVANRRCRRYAVDGGAGDRHLFSGAGWTNAAVVRPVRVPLWQCGSVQMNAWCMGLLWRLLETPHRVWVGNQEFWC